MEITRDILPIQHQIMSAKEEGAPRGGPPPRPTIALPPLSAYESLFWSGAGGAGGAAEVSPGSLTLASSFFAEDPDSEYLSFSQLMAGAMASPGGAVVPATPSSSAAPPPAEAAEKESGPGGVRPHRPLGVTLSTSPFFTVPPGRSPASLLESPAFGPGTFGMTHQQVLAQVTVQAAQANAHMQMQVEYSPDISVAAATSPVQWARASSSITSASLWQTQNLTSDMIPITSKTAEGSHSDPKSQPVSQTVDKPADDGYNWRKYGQKQVKSSEYPRSYYKCTHPGCPVKKKVERSVDGQVIEIIYKGQHNHQRPTPNKRLKDGSATLGGCNELNCRLDVPDNSETGSQGHIGNLNGTREHPSSAQMVRGDQKSGQATAELLSRSSDGEDVADTEVRMEEGNDSEYDFKRRKMDNGAIESSSSHKTVSEPRIIVQTTSDIDLLDDGYRWRKYGQKVVKGNPHPRSYYKCTSAGCNVRKHVERASTDPKAVITTYEGKHDHDVPSARNSKHNPASAGASTNSTKPKVQNLTNNLALHKRTDFKSNNQQPVAVLQLKEEHEIT